MKTTIIGKHLIHLSRLMVIVLLFGSINSVNAQGTKANVPA